jgi:hypothetical protein
MTKIITDNSKVNINLLKENELIKKENQKLKLDKKALKKQLNLSGVGWQSEQLPDFDVQEINEILKDCKEKKEDLQALICKIWNKGYMTGVCDEREG